MNIDNINALIQRLKSCSHCEFSSVLVEEFKKEQPNRRPFNMADISFYDSCGTPACMAGHLEDMGLCEEIPSTYGSVNGFNICKSVSEATHLFQKSLALDSFDVAHALVQGHFSIKDSDEIQPEEAIEALEYLRDNGEDMFMELCSERSHELELIHEE